MISCMCSVFWFLFNKSLPTKVMKIFFCVFFQELCNLSSQLNSEAHCKLIVWCDIGVKMHFPCFHLFNSSSIIHEKMILSLLHSSGTLVKNHLTVNVWGYFWYLNSVPLIYMPILLTVPMEFCPVEQTKQMEQQEWYYANEWEFRAYKKQSSLKKYSTLLAERKGKVMRIFKV